MGNEASGCCTTRHNKSTDNITTDVSSDDYMNGTAKPGTALPLATHRVAIPEKVKEVI
jgi:hypothetical protein